MENPEYNRVVYAEVKLHDKSGYIYYGHCYMDNNGAWHLVDNYSKLAIVLKILNEDLIVIDWTYASDFVQLSFVINQIVKVFIEEVISLFDPITRFFIQLLTRFLLAIHKVLLKI